MHVRLSHVWMARAMCLWLSNQLIRMLCARHATYHYAHTGRGARRQHDAFATTLNVKL